MGPTFVLSAPDGPHVGPMNLAMRVTAQLEVTSAWSWLLCEMVIADTSIVEFHDNMHKKYLTPEPSGWYFADIFKCIFFSENYYILIWILLNFVSEALYIVRVYLIINRHWFRYWFGAKQETSHPLSQWWPSVSYVYMSHQPLTNFKINNLTSHMSFSCQFP